MTKTDCAHDYVLFATLDELMCREPYKTVGTVRLCRKCYGPPGATYVAEDGSTYAAKSRRVNLKDRRQFDNLTCFIKQRKRNYGRRKTDVAKEPAAVEAMTPGRASYIYNGVDERKAVRRLNYNRTTNYFGPFRRMGDRRASTSAAAEPPKRREQSEPHYHRRYSDEILGPPTTYITHGHRRASDT